jgi:hypothetical protein
MPSSIARARSGCTQQPVKDSSMSTSVDELFHGCKSNVISIRDNIGAGKSRLH